MIKKSLISKLADLFLGDDIYIMSSTLAKIVCIQIGFSLE